MKIKLSLKITHPVGKQGGVSEDINLDLHLFDMLEDEKITEEILKEKVKTRLTEVGLKQVAVKFEPFHNYDDLSYNTTAIDKDWLSFELVQGTFVAEITLPWKQWSSIEKNLKNMLEKEDAIQRKCYLLNEANFIIIKNLASLTEEEKQDMAKRRGVNPLTYLIFSEALTILECRPNGKTYLAIRACDVQLFLNKINKHCVEKYEFLKDKETRENAILFISSGIKKRSVLTTGYDTFFSFVDSEVTSKTIKAPILPLQKASKGDSLLKGLKALVVPSSSILAQEDDELQSISKQTK